jgi:biofilm PGA synthesis N-glycosyltransferase PgaC
MASASTSGSVVFQRQGKLADSMERYVLVTAAYNEAAYIEKTIQSVVSQTVAPERWIIVSDGSTDRTDEIVTTCSKSWPFIELLRLDSRHSRNFASKVNALNVGLNLLRAGEFEFIGNLDADVSFGTSYFAELIERFRRNPTLGVAGGGIYEWNGQEYSARKHNSKSDVAGAVQLFRRQCHEAIGDFLPMRYGGEDWCAQVTARMNGWQVQSFPEIEVRHHRTTGSAAGLLRYCYRQGLMDYALGSHPLFEVGRLGRRLGTRPLVLGALARFGGFLGAYARGEKRIVSKEFVAFLRKEEMQRLRGFSRAPWRGLAAATRGGPVHSVSGRE